MAKSMLSKEEMRRLRKRITDRNYRFRKMTPEQKRVTIAKDVIAMLGKGKLKAKSGTYLQMPAAQRNAFSGWTSNGYESPKANTQVCDLLEIANKCTVCGVGAAFVATVLRADKCRVKDLAYQGNDDYMRQYLEEWFEPVQVRLIECAFEQSDYWVSAHSVGSGFRSNTVNRLAAHEAEQFGLQFKNDRDRLVAIMENIVRNNGRFVPSDYRYDDCERAER